MAVTFLGVSLALSIAYYLVLSVLTRQLGESLSASAAAGALLIDGDTFASLKEPSQMNSPEYMSVKQSLRRLKNSLETADIPLRFIYTMAPTDRPEVWKYVVDVQPEDSPDFSPLGATEDFDGGDVIIDAWKRGIPLADTHLKEYPGWGLLLTAAAVIRNSKGQPVGVLGIDAPARAVQELRSNLLLLSIVCLLAAFIVSILVSMPIGSQVTKPITALVAGTEAVAGGDLETRVDIKNRDELGTLGDAFNRMVEGLRMRDLYKRQFERYVSHQIADKILEHPEQTFWQGERKKATILFADIRGFTSMSEKLPPEQLLSRLNTFLATMIDIVFRYDGTLDKFIGDAVMAVFGAPVSFGNDALRAVQAGLAMQEAVSTMEGMWQIGIGISTGEVIVGNIGSEQRLEYSAIGDDVNVASRLEGLNKEYNTKILMSRSTYEDVKNFINARLVGEVAIRGKTEILAVYEVLGVK